MFRNLSCIVSAGILSSYHISYTNGVVGYVGQRDPATDYLLEGLTLLQERGFDSAGIATISKDTSLHITKYANTVENIDAVGRIKGDLINSSHTGNTIGIGHTRWATHGAKTDRNAHPHTDTKRRIALVHNGTIDNAHKLREQLLSQGVQFESDTDSEVIAQLVGQGLDQGLSVEAALQNALSVLEGSWGIGLIATNNPETVYAARYGSPLFIGIGNNAMYLASDRAAFSQHTREFIELRDGEIAVISATGVNLDVNRKEAIAREERELRATPDPYPFWVIREIYEQPEVVARALNFGARFLPNHEILLGGFSDYAPKLMSLKHLLITGSGSSLYSAQYVAALMRHLGCFETASSVDASEMSYQDFVPPFGTTGLLAISQSGESKDVLQQLRTASDLGVFRFSIVNNVGSRIAQMTNCGVYEKAGRERGTVATKTFLASTIVGALVAAWFAQNKSYTSDQDALLYNSRRIDLVDSLHRMSIYVGMTLQERPKLKDIAVRLKDAGHVFVLGKGFSFPIAMEGALKLKELGYIHAEGYSGGALKHGPFAVIERGTPIILIILDDEHAAMMRTAAQEVKAREAYTIVITDNPKLAQGVSDAVIYIPSNGPMTALLAAIALQLLAYEVAVLKGINPDQPRNVTKTLT